MDEEKKSLSSIMQKFQYKMNFRELKILNKNQKYGRLSWNTLLYLNIISDTKDCTASFIAKNIGVSKAAVTIRINELIAKGLVIKKQSEEDKRVNYLYVSDEIKREYDEYDQMYIKSSEETEKLFTEEEIAVVSKVLEKLSDYI